MDQSGLDPQKQPKSSGSVFTRPIKGTLLGYVFAFLAVAVLAISYTFKSCDMCYILIYPPFLVFSVLAVAFFIVGAIRGGKK